LKDEAYRLVEQRVEPHNWQAFWLRHVEEISGAEVAERLGMERATVYGVAARVLRMITHEIERLQAQELGHANVPA
jgi:DNA-directed RNA polymerase specialized sigma24 family protein